MSSNVEISYRHHPVKNGDGITTGHKFEIVICAGGHVARTGWFFGDDEFISAEMARVKSAIESGDVTISSTK